jgi:hypothetical protein
MAKPLLNLFYPELAGFAQPLAGEFAARREVLSKVPFFTGYGVEIGMLIDVFEQVGLDAMAQVELGTRQNRHQSLASLSRMSSVVLRTLAARKGLGQRPSEELDQDMSTLWEIHQPDTYLHAVTTEEGLRLDEYLNELVERPPLATLADGEALSATALPPLSPSMTPVPGGPDRRNRDRIEVRPWPASRCPGRPVPFPTRSGPGVCAAARMTAGRKLA